MPSIHRIQWFDARVRTGRYPSARSLAERFEISHRQAQRDIEYIRDSLGAPLEYVASRRGTGMRGHIHLARPGGDGQRERCPHGSGIAV